MFLLLAAAAGAIQVPYVQTKLVNYISKRLSEATSYQISINRINIDWFDQVELEGLRVLDPFGNPMIEAKTVNINYKLKTLLDNKSPYPELSNDI